MWSRCTVIFCLFFTAQSAVVKTRNIPVEIVYDRSNQAQYGTRNLDAKIQLSSDELLKLKLSDDIINEKIQEETGVKNLEEKIQLSQEELNQAVKNQQNQIDVEGDIKAAIAETTESPQQHNLLYLIKRAEEIAYSGINTIRNNIEAASESITETKPSPEAWEKLNQTLQEFFREQYKSVISLKQDAANNNENVNQNQNQNQNQFMQNLINGFQTITNNFMSNFNQNNQTQRPSGSEDEQQQQQQQQNQGPFQNFVNFFQGGITNMINNMNNLSPQNGTSGQEDTGTGGGSNGGFFGNLVNQFQQFIQNQGNNQGSNPAQQININQSDTGVQPTTNAPGGFFQGAINQFNQVVNNFRPSTSARPPVQGDEGSTTQSSNFIQSIGQAFQNVNIFRPQGGQGGTQGGSGSNPIVSGAQAIGGQFAGQGGNGSNPFVSGAQAIGGQFAGQGGNGSNPFVSGAQAIGSQFGIGGQNNGTNPFVQGAQQIGNQFQQAIGQGSKPSEGGMVEGSTEKTRGVEVHGGLKEEEKKEEAVMAIAA